MNRMKNAPLRGLALALGLLAAMPCALAQSVGGNASLSVTTGTARVPFPANAISYPFALLAPAQGSAQEMFYKLGDVTVTAATTGAALPPAGLCIAIGPNTNVAAITASGSATLRVTQLSQCPPTGFGGGNSGGSVMATQSTSTPFSAILPNNTTAVPVAVVPQTLTSLGCFNATATIFYVKVYNAISATAGSGTPLERYGCPASTSGAGRTTNYSSGHRYSVGITYVVTTGIADNDTTAPAANAGIVEMGTQP